MQQTNRWAGRRLGTFLVCSMDQAVPARSSRGLVNPSHRCLAHWMNHSGHLAGRICRLVHLLDRRPERVAAASPHDLYRAFGDGVGVYSGGTTAITGRGA